MGQLFRKIYIKVFLANLQSNDNICLFFCFSEGHSKSTLTSFYQQVIELKDSSLQIFSMHPSVWMSNILSYISSLGVTKQINEQGNAVATILLLAPFKFMPTLRWYSRTHSYADSQLLEKYYQINKALSIQNTRDFILSDAF